MNNFLIYLNYLFIFLGITLFLLFLKFIIKKILYYDKYQKQINLDFVDDDDDIDAIEL
jgi:hypothetical protein